MKKYDFIFLLVFIILIIFLILTDLIYPFNRYYAYDENIAKIIQKDFPPFWITIIFLIISACFFIFWIIYSKENLNIILILCGFFLSLLGPLSIGKIYSTDAIYNLGIINRLTKRDIIFPPPKKKIHYPGLMFHYILLPFTTILSSYNAMLYIAPILIFFLSVPLGNKLINMPKKFKNKLIIGIIYFCFPFVSGQKYNSTPYALLISIYSLFIFFLISKQKNYLYYCFFLAIVGSLVHIHGVFMFFLLLIPILRKRINNITRYYIYQFLLPLIFIIPYISILFSNNIYFRNESLYDYLMRFDNNLISYLLYTITKPGGFLSKDFLPKISSGGLFSVWYMIQFLLFLIFLILFLYILIKIIKIITQKFYISQKYFSKKGEFNIFLEIFSITYNIIILLIISLFFSYNFQLWRFMDILLFLELFLILNIEKVESKDKKIKKIIEKIKRIKIKYIYASIFIFLFISPLIIYYQFTPYNESEKEMVEWTKDYYLQSSDNIIIFTDGATYKLFWALAPELDEDLYEWERDFWLTQDISFIDYFKRKIDQVNLTILLTITPRRIAWEAQFNNVNLVQRISLVINKYSTKLVYINDKGNMILKIDLE